MPSGRGLPIAEKIVMSLINAFDTNGFVIRRGLLQKTENPKDARSSLLALTPFGSSVLEKDPIRELEIRLAMLGTEDQRLLQNLLIRLMKP